MLHRSLIVLLKLAANSSSVTVLHRSGIVLLKAAEKRLSQTGSVDGMVESLSAKNIPSLLPPPSTMVKVQIR